MKALQSFVTGDCPIAPSIRSYIKKCSRTLGQLTWTLTSIRRAVFSLERMNKKKTLWSPQTPPTILNTGCHWGVLTPLMSRFAHFKSKKGHKAKMDIAWLLQPNNLKMSLTKKILSLLFKLYALKFQSLLPLQSFHFTPVLTIIINCFSIFFEEDCTILRISFCFLPVDAINVITNHSFFEIICALLLL